VVEKAVGVGSEREGGGDQNMSIRLIICFILGTLLLIFSMFFTFGGVIAVAGLVFYVMGVFELVLWWSEKA